MGFRKLSPIFLAIGLTSVLSMTQYSDMAKKPPKPTVTCPKNREATPGETAIMEKDIAEIEKLGFTIPSIAVGEVGEPLYDLAPPKDKPMHQWRQDLERAGFEVVSKLKPDELGFSAQRRSMKGQGWT